MTAYGLYRLLTTLIWWLLWPWRAFVAARGSREWRERLGELPSAVPEGVVWVHAASVGEVGAAAAVVDELVARGHTVLVTVVTRTGRAVADRTLGASAGVAYAPLDFPSAVRRALDRVRPRAVLLVETELWPNLIVEAAGRGSYVAVVNGRLSSGNLGRSLSPWSPVRRAARALALALCQTEEDRERFVRLGVAGDAAMVVGNTKFDALAKPLGAQEKLALRDDLGIPASSPVVVFGSVRPDEEESVAAAAAEIAGAVSTVRFVAAPRHLDRAAPLAALLDGRGVRTSMRSAGPLRGAALVLDTTGELATIYGVADLAFVGGSLAPYGGHNPLEPAGVGTPVLVGPHTESCEEAVQLLVEAGAAFVVADGGELAATTIGLLRDDAVRGEAARRALEAVRGGRGAAARTAAIIEERVARARPGPGAGGSRP